MPKSEDFVDIDFDDIEEEDDDQPDTFMEMAANALSSVDWILLFCICITYVIVFSTAFDDRVLSKMSGAKKDTGEMATKGYLANLLFILSGGLLGKFAFAIAS